MPFEYNKDYTSSQLPSELVDVGSGEVRYYEGVPYRVINTGTGGRRLEKPSFTETGVRPEDRVMTEEEIYQKNKQRYAESIAPSVKSYQETIPETQKRFSTERERLSGESARLEDRYRLLIDDIKRNQGVAETRQTRSTGAELARRGISQESGVYGQEMTQALNPITESYTSQIKGTGLEREDQIAKIRDIITQLAGGETDAVRAITQAIANLQSGAGAQAITGSMQEFQNQIQNALSKGQLTIQQAQQALAERAQKFTESQKATPQTELKYANVLGGGYIYDPYTGQVTNTLKDLRGGAGGGGVGKRPPLESFESG